nr:hypothetical protein [Caballeronia sordidicola]
MSVTPLVEPYLPQRAVEEHGAELDICCKSSGAKLMINASSIVCAFKLASAQDRHRSIAQLSCIKSRDLGTCEGEVLCFQAAVRRNSCAETRHHPTRERERRMRAFLYRKQFAVPLVAWRKLAELALNPWTAI